MLCCLLFLWPCSRSNIRQIPRREAFSSLETGLTSGGWVGGQKAPSHLAAVWRPRAQSSHLSSLIKTSGICMTAPCPHLFLLNQRLLKGDMQKQWQRMGPGGMCFMEAPFPLIFRPVASDCPNGGLCLALSPVYHQPPSSFIRRCAFFFNRTRKATPPPAISQTLYYMILAIVVKNL